MAKAATEQISSEDWEATPKAVREVIRSLEHERDSFRERLERIESAQDATSEEYKRLLKRYHVLVERQYLKGLTPDEQVEIDQLGKQIDTVNSGFYPSLQSLAQTIAENSDIQSK